VWRFYDYSSKQDLGFRAGTKGVYPIKSIRSTYNASMKTKPLFLSGGKKSEGVVIAFSVILSLFIAACQDGRVSNQSAFPKSSEQRRVTSPNGRFDAVLVTDLYGPAAGGGVDSNVYIVAKGAPVYAKAGKEVFRADPMTGGDLVWRRDHLLEIHYDIAYIHTFRNVWGLYEIENVGSTGERDYEVEIRLMPASDSSALKPDGSFRHPGYE
jgi:hypothetical protein